MAKYSKLSSLVPSIGTFFTHLPLKQAFLEYDQQNHISDRQFVPPSFNDIRRILNLAQICAIAKPLKLITFDGDVTLYADGKDLPPDSPLVGMIISMMKQGLFVALVTAAGYTDAKRYNQRLHGLLEVMKRQNLSAEVRDRLFVVGGECNYLLQANESYELAYQPMQPAYRDTYATEEVQSFLDLCESTLKSCIERMHLSARVLRKELAVGLIPSIKSVHSLQNPGTLLPYQIGRERLDECVLATQHAIRQAYATADQIQQQQQTPSPPSPVLKPTAHLSPVSLLSTHNKLSAKPYAPPHCVFNGGQDVWVDIGNKLLGVQMLQQRLSCDPSHTLHIGDQFLSTGNDIATRSACATVWIVNPEETEVILDTLLSKRKN